jgi:hypothetical protein
MVRVALLSVVLPASNAGADEVSVLTISIPAVAGIIPSVVNPGENIPVDSAVMRHRGFACFQGVPLIRFEVGGAPSDSTVNKIPVYVDPAFPKIDGSGYRELSLDFTVKAISDKGINYGRSAINYHEIIQVIDNKEFSHQLTVMVGSNKSTASGEALISYVDNLGKKQKLFEAKLDGVRIEANCPSPESPVANEDLVGRDGVIRNANVATSTKGQVVNSPKKASSQTMMAKKRVANTKPITKYKPKSKKK